jgi:LysM repeat protein
MKNKRFIGLFFAAQVIFGAILLLQSGCETTQPNGTLVRRSSRQTSSSSVSVKTNTVAKNAIPPAQTPAPAAQSPVVRSGDIPLAQGTPRQVNPAYNTNLLSPSRPTEPTVAESNEAGAILEPSGKAAATASETYVVQKGDTLNRIAKTHGCSVSDLKSANNLAGNDIKIGQKLIVPASFAAQSEIAAAGQQTYTVQKGDTLSRIATMFDVSVASIKETNSLASDNIKTGQTIVLPANASATPKEVAAPKPTVKASGHSYTVQKGDTVGSIASRANCKQKDLMELNDISDPKKLRVGEKLKLPAGSKAIKAETAAKASKSSSKTASSGKAGSSNGNLLPTDNILSDSPAPAPTTVSPEASATTAAPAASTATESAPAPVTVQPDTTKASSSSSGLESLDGEPVTPTVPVQSDSGSSTEQP